MKKYEIMFIFQSKSEKVAKAKKTVVDLFAQENIKIESEEDFGKRILAYPIRKHTHGHYWLYNLAMKPEKAQRIDLLFKHSDEVLRTLVVKK